MVSFCSLLVYKGLSDHVRSIVLKKIDKNIKFTGNSPSKRTGLEKDHYISVLPLKGSRKRRIYRKHIVNKWHVMLLLLKNPVLLMYRKNLNNYKKVDNK